MIGLAHRISERHHDHASWVPGYYQPTLRLGHWRWVRYPDYFNHKHVNSPGELWVHWIDSALKEQVQQARKSGETFPPMILVYDQWK
jgi:microcin C transport system substrate-binding protein